MAPNTNLGAAHPVDSRGGPVGEKIVNDATAYIRSLAAQKGRDAEWAARSVRQSESLSEQEALKLKVVELVAADEAELLKLLDGRTLKKGAASLALHTSGSEVLRILPTGRERLVSLLADPTLAYVLFLVGIYAIIFEVTHTGFILPGVAGAICLILAFISFGSLPVNYGALALLGLGVLLFAAEAFAFSHGALALGGAAAMLLGSLMLYRSDLPAFRLPWPLILLTVGSSAAFFLLVIARAIASIRRRRPKGLVDLVGEVGVAKTPLDPEGMVHVGGEDWTAVAWEGKIPAKSAVKVVDAQGLKLTVRKEK
jgi:membrane-bound serine protease (ClpP class)